MKSNYSIKMAENASPMSKISPKEIATNPNAIANKVSHGEALLYLSNEVILYDGTGQAVKHLFIFIYLFLEQKSISKGAVRRLGYKPPALAPPHVNHKLFSQRLKVLIENYGGI